MRTSWNTPTRKHLRRRIVAVSIALLLIAIGLWWYAYGSLQPGEPDNYRGKIQLTSMTIDQARHIQHKYRIRQVKRHYLSSKSGSRLVGTCRNYTSHDTFGHKLLMNVVEVWVQVRWCNKRSNHTQIAIAKVTSVRVDTEGMLNPWRDDGATVLSERYWDAQAYSEIARKVVYIKLTQHIGPLDIQHKTIYFDLRMNALHMWFRGHVDIGESASSYTPSW